MSGLRVLIVGASIAGPTAAYWFARTGARITIIERFPAIRPGGQSIDIRTVGVEVMRKMPGMEAAVRARLAPISGFAIVTESGKPLATIMASGDADRQSLVSEFEIFRGDLNRVLYDMTKDLENVRYVFGEQVAAMGQGGNGDGPVAVEFANGWPAGEYDLVVAADGAASRTRAMGLGCGVRDYVTSFNTWAAYFTVKKDFVDGSRISQAYYKTPGRMYALGSDHAPGCNKAMLASVYHSKDDSAMPEFRQAVKQGEASVKALVAKRFRGGGWKGDEIVEEMMRSDDFYASEWSRVNVPSLSKGRFVLVGDAAHSAGPTGTGTSLALAGAYLLAGEVSKHAGNIEAGLKAYEERMQPLLKEMTSIPPFFPAMIAPQAQWSLWLRNIVIAVLCWGAATFGKWFSWIEGFISGALAKNKNDLPEYEWKVDAKKQG